MDALQVAIDEAGKRETKRPETNADGDTIADMRAVQDRFGAGSVQNIRLDCSGWSPVRSLWGFDGAASDYRITAKHATIFDPDCMDFETWARAAIGRGLVCRGKGKMNTGGTKTCYCSTINSGSMYDESDGHQWPLDCAGGGWKWTAITLAQREQETKPEEPKPDANQFSFSADLHEGVRLNLIDIASGLCANPQITSVEINGNEISISGYCDPMGVSFE